MVATAEAVEQDTLEGWDWEGLRVTREKLALAAPKALDVSEVDGSAENAEPSLLLQPGDEITIETTYRVTSVNHPQKFDAKGIAVGKLIRQAAAKPILGRSILTNVRRRAAIEADFQRRVERGDV